MKKSLAIFSVLAIAVTAFAGTRIKDTAAGYQVGTDATQKVGFHGATPVAQRSGTMQGALSLVYAGGTYTFTAQPAANDTVTLGSITYTFKTALTGTTLNQVLISGTGFSAIGTTQGYLVTAIAKSGTTGVLNISAANTRATAVASGSAAIVATAVLSGTRGNAITSTAVSSGTNASWGAATLIGGTQVTDINAVADLLQEIRASMVEKGLIKGAP